MTRSQSLKAALLADGTVAGLIGARIYPLVALPPGSQPLLVYKFEADYDYVISGGVEKINAPLEIKSWAVDYDVAHSLADAVQAVLMPAGQAKGFNGHLGGTGGIKVIHCLIDREEENVVAITPDQYVFEVVSRYDLKYIL